MFTEVRLEAGVEVDIGSVVADEVELDLLRSLSLHVVVVERVPVGRDARPVGAGEVLKVPDGRWRDGTTEIRTWETGAASKYTYTTEITDTEALGPDRYLVTGRLTGNFPGGTADLKWDFSIAGQHITWLTIAP